MVLVLLVLSWCWPGVLVLPLPVLRVRLSQVLWLVQVAFWAAGGEEGVPCPGGEVSSPVSLGRLDAGVWLAPRMSALRSVSVACLRLAAAAAALAAASLMRTRASMQVLGCVRCVLLVVVLLVLV